MKAFKKLVPAIALLLVSAVLLGTSTFAWFSMNKVVTVSGMSVKTSVSSNLFIANDEDNNQTYGCRLHQQLHFDYFGKQKCRSRFVRKRNNRQFLLHRYRQCDGIRRCKK